MKDGLKKINSTIHPLIWVLLIYLGIMLIFGHYKSYLYEDEVLSYTAANYHSPNKGVRFDLSDRTLYDASDILNAITAVSGETFDYANVVKNTSYDPHPPLFLFLLHTLSSLFPGVFSVWFGLSINIVFGILTLTILYMLSFKITESKSFAVFTSLVYACMNAFISISDYLRMYVMLGFFTLVLLLLYVMLMQSLRSREKPVIKEFLPIILTTVFGTLTQYYFLVFAFYAAFFFEILLIIKKRYKDAIFHALSYIISGIAVLLLFPSIIWQMTESRSATASFDIAAPSQLISRIYQMFILLNIELFSGRLKWIILVILAFFIWRFFFHKERNPFFKNSELIPAAFIIWVISMYFATVSATTPHLTVRYVSPVYAPLTLILLLLLRPVIKEVFALRPVGYLLVYALFSLSLISTVKSGLYDVNKAIMQETSKSYSDDYCILLSSGNPEENFFELMNFKGFYRIHMDEDFEAIDESIASAEELVIYVPEKRSLEECMEYLQHFNPNLKYSKMLYKAYYADAYLFSSEEKD